MTQPTHVMSSEGLDELVKQIDPAETLDNDVKEVREGEREQSRAGG